MFFCDMDRVEIVDCRASGEAVFWGVLRKMAFGGIERIKMVTNGGPSMHFQMALPLSKEWGDPQEDIVVMVQGEPMVTPEMIEQPVTPTLIDTSINVVNLMAWMKTV